MDCDLHKGIFQCGRVIIKFTHVVFKLLTYNQINVMIICIPCLHCSTYKNKHCGGRDLKQ